MTSLRRRALVGAIIWVSVALGMAALALFTLVRDHVEAQARADLAAHMEQLIAALSVDESGGVALSADLSDPRFRRPYAGLYWQVAGTTVLLRSRSLWDADLGVPADTLHEGAVHLHRVIGPRGEPLLALERDVALPELDGRLRVIVAVDAAIPDRAVRAFGGELAMTVGILGLLLVIAAWIQAGLVLRPLNRLRARLAEVRAGRASRLGGPFPAEIQPLAEDLDKLLDHGASQIERARRQAGDLAHGLKTPLAVVAAEAGTLAPETAAVLNEQVELMRRRVDAHLARARAAAARDLPGIRAEFRPVAEQLSRALVRLHGIGMAVEGGGVFLGDGQDLEEMLGNLMENAAKWAATEVAVEAVPANGRLRITVTDDGPGLPEEIADTVFQRGRRLDESRPGSGLGLSITRELAEAYGGTVTLEAATGGGCRAVLDLPGA